MKALFSTLLFTIVCHVICIAQPTRYDVIPVSGTVKEIIQTEEGYFAYIKEDYSNLELRALISKNILQCPDSYIIFKKNDHIRVWGKCTYKDDEKWDSNEYYRMNVKKFSFLITDKMMKKIISSRFNKDSIKLENIVSFSWYKDDTNDSVFHINCRLKIINLSNRFIPTLTVPNNERLTTIYINGKKTGPQKYSGNNERLSNEALSKNNCSDTYTGWVLTPISKIYGNRITVQWKYMGIWSDKVTVDIKNRKIIQ